MTMTITEVERSLRVLRQPPLPDLRQRNFMTTAGTVLEVRRRPLMIPPISCAIQR
jgi:hypothetical protein